MINHSIILYVDFPGWESFARISFNISLGLVRDNVYGAGRSCHKLFGHILLACECSL